MTRLQDLYDIGGQSPWLDNLRRDWLEDGQLAELRRPRRPRHHLEPDHLRQRHQRPGHLRRPVPRADEGPHRRGRLLGDGDRPTSTTRWTCCDRSTTTATARTASSPSRCRPTLAHDTEGTVARRPASSTTRIAQPNLFVKVPATHEGVPAIETLIGEGRSINVTLIFGLDRYDEVMEAYLRGLEALVAAHREAELPRVASVASFFVSRVDTEVDRRLEALAGGEQGDPAVLGPAGHRRGGPGPDGLPALPPHLRRRALGGAAGRGRPGAAAAVGVDLDQEPGLLRPALRGQPDRAGHGEHHARGDARAPSRTTGR